MDVRLAVRDRVNGLHELREWHARVEFNIVVGRKFHTRSVRAELLTVTRNEAIPRIANECELEIGFVPALQSREELLFADLVVGSIENLVYPETCSAVPPDGFISVGTDVEQR